MANAANIKCDTIAEIQVMRARCEDQTDRHRLATMTEAQLEAAIASDPDWKVIPADWVKNAIPVTPAPKQRRPCASMPTSSPGADPRAPASKPA